MSGQTIFSGQTTDATSDWYPSEGPGRALTLRGSLGGGTVKVEVKDSTGQGVTLVDDAGDDIALTTLGSRLLDLLYGTQFRLVLSGATGANLTAGVI